MKRASLYIIPILFLAVSCKKAAPQMFTKDSYPMAVGNWWQYMIIDCTGGLDTFTLNTVSVTDFASYKDFKCNFVYHNNVTGSGDFIQSDTSISFVNRGNAYFSIFPDFHIRFPVYTGQYWAGTFKGDSIRVVGVTDPCGGFGHIYGPCYSTVESYILPHNFLVSNKLLTPKIGMISGSTDFKSDTANGFGINTCQTVYLINYHIEE